GWKSGAVTTLGRGGSDLTATTIGKALGLREIQVWKDVDGVLTCDPNIYSHAKTVLYLTFEEATELAYFGAQVLHPQSMRPAREGDIPVRVKNSYNPKAPGTLIMLKSNVTMLDIVSTRMLGQYGFLARVFAIFEDLCISVDCVATSEVSVSVSLDPSKIWRVDCNPRPLGRHNVERRSPSSTSLKMTSPPTRARATNEKMGRRRRRGASRRSNGPYHQAVQDGAKG
ncbi:hypothetical protein ACJX0J_006742, partial [Zea mays]